MNKERNKPVPSPVLRRSLRCSAESTSTRRDDATRRRDDATRRASCRGRGMTVTASVVVTPPPPDACATTRSHRWFLLLTASASFCFVAGDARARPHRRRRARPAGAPGARDARGGVTSSWSSRPIISDVTRHLSTSRGSRHAPRERRRYVVVVKTRPLLLCHTAISMTGARDAQTSCVTSTLITPTSR